MMSIPPDVSRENFRIDGDLQIEGSLLPSEGSAFDLGSDTRRFRDLYLGDPITGYVPTIHFGDQTLTANDILDIKYLATEQVLYPGRVSFFTDIYEHPTTLGGYGITDAATFVQGERADSVYNSVLATSSNWDSTHTSVNTTSSNWDSTYSSVNNTSGTWDSVYTSVGSNSSRWEEVYNNVSNNTSQFLNINTVGTITAGNIKSNGDIETTNRLLGPEVFYIDPAGHGDNTGKVIISGDLQVDGVTTTVNSSTLSIVDKLIEISKGSTTGAEANGAGIHVQGADATWTYTDASTSWDSNKDVRIVSTDPDLTLHYVTANRNSKLGHNNFGAYWKLSNNGDTFRLVDATGDTKLYINPNTSRMGINTDVADVTLHVEGSDALLIPRGTTAERPIATSATHQGYIRYNTTTKQFEGFGAGDSWGSLGGVMDVDQDTYISPEASPGSDDDTLILYTAGVERMRANSSGVGIATRGDKNARDALHVGGTFRVSHNIGANSTYDVISFASDRTIDDYGGVNQEYWKLKLQTPPNEHRTSNLVLSAKIDPTSGVMSDRVTFTHDGKVGIGTTDPAYSLHVHNNSTGSSRIRLQNTEGAWDWAVDQQDMYFAHGSSIPLYINSSGNIGISTTTVNNKLQIGDTGHQGYVFYGKGEAYGAVLEMGATTEPNPGAAALWIRNLHGGTGFTDLFRVQNNGQVIIKSSDERLQISSVVDDSGIFIGQWDGGNNRIESAGRPLFLTSYTDGIYLGSSGSKQCVFKNSGNVGVGTLSPSARLHILSTDTSQPTLLLQNNTDELNTTLSTIEFANGSDPIAVIESATSSDAGTNSGELRFKTSFFGLPLEQMRMTPIGIGIGTTSPEHRLHVQGTVKADRFYDGSDDTHFGSLVLYNESGDTVFDRHWSSGETNFIIKENGVDQLIVKESGKVGIGESLPEYQLHVAGSGDVLVEDTGGGSAHYRMRSTDQGTVLSEWKIKASPEGKFEIDNDVKGVNAMCIDEDNKVGIGTRTPQASLDVPFGVSKPRVTKFGNDITSHYSAGGYTNNKLEFTCGSYYQSEVIITAHQTNGGSSNNLYIRGIWHNNYDSHHWDELENVGGLTGSSFSISVGENDVFNSGKLTIQQTYSSGSFTRITVRVTDFYGTHEYSITQ